MKEFKSVFIKYIKDYRLILCVYIFIVIISSIIKYLEGPKVMAGVMTTHYNNYLTFKFSFLHLIHNQDIYIYHPTDYLDLFKYSPAFAVFMGLFSYLLNLIGLILWNLLNSIPLFFAVKQLPNIDDKFKVSILWFILIQMLTSIQNSQSNGLVLAIFIYLYIYLEKDNPFISSLFFIIGIFIKIYSGVSFLLILFYPNKTKFIVYSFLWTLIFTFIPLLLISPNQLLFTYQSWFRMLTTDYLGSTGLSVMGWLNSWFAYQPGNNIVLIVGFILLLVPLINFKKYQDRGYRILYLGLMLIWVIIFNHKAESPTFIIAICGIGLWYFLLERTKTSLVIVIVAFVFTSLSSSDIFPHYVREHIINPYVLKVIPSIFIFFCLLYQLTFNRYKIREKVLILKNE